MSRRILIATHNSATGERGQGFLSWLVSPFSKCQSKTLAEQWEAGCRYFDIRYKWSDKRGCYICAHGLWQSERSLREVLAEIDELGKCYVMVTCERGAPLPKSAIRHIIANHVNICFTYFSRKMPRWKLDYCNIQIPHINGYQMLGWHDWHTLIPIPRLWKCFYKEPPMNEDKFTFIDFL